MIETWVHDLVQWILITFALPQVGLNAIFVVSFVSATLLPLGSEPAVFGYVSLAPQMFWPAVVVATVGNTLGGLTSYWTGALAQRAYQRWRVNNPNSDPEEKNNYGEKTAGRWHQLINRWLERFGPPALLLSWLPIVGDPLCALAGWLRLPLWQSTVYMAIGKFLRYVIMTAFLIWIAPYFGLEFS